MKICRCGELLVTPVQLRTGWCCVRCQQAHTPRPTPAGNAVTPGKQIAHTGATINRVTPNASPRDNRE